MKGKAEDTWWYCSHCNSFNKDSNLIRNLLHPETIHDPAEWENLCPDCRSNQDSLHTAYVCEACSEMSAYCAFVHITGMCIACEKVYAEEEGRDPYPEGTEDETRTPQSLVQDTKDSPS